MIDNNFSYIDENYKRICYNVNEAKAKYRASSDVIEIMAVTKTVEPEAINHAIGLGIKTLGENRVQEYLSKRDYYNKAADVQFIGHLQTNKVKYIIDSVSLIQSVDRIKLAEEINRLAAKAGIVKDILIEVNVGGEYTKSGISPEMLPNMLDECQHLGNICIKGLMTIPPPLCDEYIYSKMQQLYIDNKAKKRDNVSMSMLSMGMSSDYAMANKAWSDHY